MQLAPSADFRESDLDFQRVAAAKELAAKVEAYSKAARGRQRPDIVALGDAFSPRCIVPGDDNRSVGSRERRQRRSYPRQAGIAMDMREQRLDP